MQRGTPRRNHEGQPSLTVLEGGRESDDSPMIPGTLRQKVGAVLSIIAIGVGMNALFDIEDKHLAARGIAVELECSDKTMPLITPKSGIQSEAVAAIPGVDNADEMTRVPITLSDDSRQLYGKFGPNGAPSDARIPVSC